ncbi:MAG TPA: SIMPL domain-containing protein [Steroidobacteraceae bacterium]|jgi:uncharacterized protein YggE|nr:SIMPL domain-containing protein [Steroidobacteraceae bacterium]
MTRLAALMLVLLTTTAAMAADAPPTPIDPVPKITVSGAGEAIAPAARARFNIGIESSGATAAAAGTEGARIADAVTTALHRAGLPAADLKSTHLVINPQWVYDDHTHQRRRNGFQAETTLMIDTAALERLGGWIDVALGSGATNVSDPVFAPADEAALRHIAVSRAVQSARGDAEVMASAAGGALGSLLQLSSGQGAGEPVPMMRAFAAAAAVPGAPPTNIQPGDIHVSATVTGVWRYIEGAAAPSR